jgi:hypothetical protein
MEAAVSYVARPRIRIPWTSIWLAFVVLILAPCVAIGVGMVLPTPPAVVHITEISWASNGTLLSHGSGYTTTAGAEFRLVLVDTNFGGAELDYTSASVTAGFTVLSADLPAIPSGAVENLTVLVRAPSFAYTGPLVVTLRA